MAIKLHTRGLTFIKGPHPCATVMKALDDEGIAYEQVKHPSFGRGRRSELKSLSGQDKLPVVEFEDGRIYRAESKDMAARIRAGQLGSS